ncbi:MULTISPECIES: hypothetical protein [unclassified Marinobacter]|uniref:hypothetical protein n=1 Tax=unclassified Marinobacter TaxID=83889 RepID=UPI001E358113|nr:MULTISPECIES: hypothetical protein [unclassified Marinobacter]
MRRFCSEGYQVVSLEHFEANWRINLQGLVAAAKAAQPQLRQQDAPGWTHELDIRPFGENW